jgi:two-component system cell cycle sensor histidine kinase/response regulator CckA
VTGITQHGGGAAPSGAGEALNPPHTLFAPDSAEQMRWAQKIEALGQLSGRMVHEISNQVTLVLGRVALSLGRTDTSSATLTDLEEIKHAAEQLARLTREWLTLSRKEAPLAAPVDLNGLLDQRLTTFDLCLGNNIELVFAKRASPATLLADRGHLEQVMLNLVLNARDAITGPGLVTVSTANVVLTGTEDDLLLPCTPGPYVQLAVNDTGRGIEAGTLAQIFEPYFSTKPSGRGTGLGLYHVREIVRECRGTMRVTSVPGRGSTFSVFFPQMADEEVVPRANVGPATTPVPATILLIEDDDSVRALVREVLRRQGHRILEASRGVEALKICAAQGSPIDLLVTDRGLPDMSGREVARRLTALHPALRVLQISGYTSDHDFAPGEADSDVHFLQKPFTAAELTAAVRDLLAR